MVLPQPVGPTSATRWPGGHLQGKVLDQLPAFHIGEAYLLDVHRTVRLLQHPGILSVRLLGFFLNQLTREAQAKAFCSSVTTPEISLKGLVYWLA